MGARFPGVDPQTWRRYATRLWIEGPDGLDLRYDPALRDAMLENAASAAPDAWPLFNALSGMPVAILRGENSDLLSRETLRAMQDAHPGAIAAEVPDRGHVPFLDEPESLALMSRFLERVS